MLSRSKVTANRQSNQPGHFSKHRTRRLAEGRCWCRGGPPVVPGKTMCEACLDKLRKKSAGYVSARRAAGLCLDCGKQVPRHGARCDECRVIRRDKKRRERQLVLDHYGRHCACCGEKEETFLAIDHVDGHGNEHRRAVGTRNIYLWIIRSGYPAGFQTLCHNCNFAKHACGTCPHQRALEVVGVVLTISSPETAPAKMKVISSVPDPQMSLF